MRLYREENPERTKELWTKANDERRKYHREYHAARKNDPEYKRKRRDCTLRRKYGISIEDYEDMVVAQKGCCAICEEYMGEKLRVDHNHTTGKVRGLLCDPCNVAIGLLKENTNALCSAIAYINQGVA